MDKIRVDTELLGECAISIDRSGKTASSLASDIRSVLSALPECCTEKYGRLIQSYEKEARSISVDLFNLSDGVDKAVDHFSECEKYIRERNVFEEAPDAEIGDGGNEASFWKTWPFSWIDGVLDWLGIDKYGRDYEDPGKEAENAQNDSIRNQISDLFSSAKYSSETWEHATVEERKQILNNLLKDLNAIYGTSITKDINFFTEKADSRGVITLGYYTDSKRQVSINTEILTSDNYYDVMNTMVHEMRHAYQHEAVRHPNDFIVSEETVRSWEDNFDNYISYTEKKNNFDEYRYQPVEADAHDIADNVDYYGEQRREIQNWL